MILLKDYLEYPFKDQKWGLVICRNPDEFVGTLEEWRKVYYEIFGEETDKDIQQIKRKLKQKYSEVFK